MSASLGGVGFEMPVISQRLSGGAEEFVGEFKYGKMTVEQGKANMQLFADEVLPALHAATPADPLPANVPAKSTVSAASPT